MNHVWESLLQWKYIWEEQIEDEKNKPDHEFKEAEIKLLTEQLEAIEEAMAIVGRWN